MQEPVQIGGAIRRGHSFEVLSAEIGGAPRVLVLPPPDLPIDREIETAFLRASSLPELPCTPRLFGSGKIGDRPYLAFEAIDGPDLESLLSAFGAEPMSPAIAVALVEVLAGAVAVAHARGFDHRAIHPSRVRVTRTGEPILTGLGLGALRVRLLRAPSPRLYPPPESVSGPAADVYALGKLLERCAPSVPVIARATAADPSARPTAQGLAEACAALAPASRAELEAWLAASHERWRRGRVAALWAPPEDEGVVSSIFERPTAVKTVLAALPHGVSNLPDDPDVTAATVPELDDAPAPLLAVTIQHSDSADDGDREVLAGAESIGYRVLSVLGRGSYGVVYDAERDGRRCALKVLRRRYLGADTARRRLLREAETLASVDHPNVVRVLDFGVLPGNRPYLALERLEGETLATRFTREHRATPAEALAIVRQVAAGLAAVHERGVVHRDLKPANVFLLAGGGVKLLDFGIARLPESAEATRLTRMGLLGTPQYMAPEQLEDPAKVGPAADLFGVGAILYFLLRGLPPFSESSGWGQRRTEEPQELTNPGALGQLAMQLLAPEPSDRLASAQAILERLDRIAAEDAASPVPPPERSIEGRGDARAVESTAILAVTAPVSKTRAPARVRLFRALVIVIIAATAGVISALLLMRTTAGPPKVIPPDPAHLEAPPRPAPRTSINP